MVLPSATHPAISLIEGPTILWVDDRPDSAIFQSLERDGYTVIGARSGAAALGLATNAAHALIVVDLHLPDIHGLTVLERIRTHGINTPTVAIAPRFLEPEVESHARAVGVHAFRYKPIAIEDLTALVRELLGTAIAATSGGAPTALAVLVVRLNRVIAMEADPRALSTMVYALLSVLADPALPLESFEPCTHALRISLNATVEDSVSARAVRARNMILERTRPRLAVRDARIRRALDLLFQAPRWCGEGALAQAAGMSRSRFARLVRQETSVDYRVLRRHVVMRAGVAEVLGTSEQIAQVAHRLGIPPGSFDRMFRETFGCPPRELRRLWLCMREKHVGELLPV